MQAELSEKQTEIDDYWESDWRLKEERDGALDRCEELEAAACVWRKPLLQKNQERESSRSRTWKSWSSEKTSSHYSALFNETTISPLCFYCSLKLRLIFMKGGKYNEEEFSEKIENKR